MTDILIIKKLKINIGIRMDKSKYDTIYLYSKNNALIKIPFSYCDKKVENVNEDNGVIYDNVFYDYEFSVEEIKTILKLAKADSILIRFDGNIKYEYHMEEGCLKALQGIMMKYKKI